MLSLCEGTGRLKFSSEQGKLRLGMSEMLQVDSEDCLTFDRQARGSMLLRTRRGTIKSLMKRKEWVTAHRKARTCNENKMTVTMGEEISLSARSMVWCAKFCNLDDTRPISAFSTSEDDRSCIELPLEKERERRKSH